MRLLEHLWYKQRCRDRDELWAIAEAKHKAASRIQAYVKGIWDRRWVRRHRAVLLIQKNWKFFNGLRKWKQMKRGRILYGVTKVVGKLIDRAVAKRVNQLVALHSKMLIRPQALMRGFLIRSLIHRARAYATKLALAAVKVQRFWRQSGAMTKAVEEVMARKRMEMNPFKLCGSLHEVLLILRQQCQDLYSSVDPRIGLKMTSFLYRMGYSELEIFFPRRGFSNAVDGKALTVKKLTEWYDVYQAKEREKERLAALKNNVTLPPKRTKPAPLAAFQALVAVLRVPLYPRVVKHRQKLQVIQAFPDFASPYEAFLQVRKLFLKKFGRNLQTRAASFAKEIIEVVYPSFNCHHAFGDKVLTVAQIQKAISSPQDSSQVMKALEEVRGNRMNAMEEKKYDIERLRAASNMLQLAFDRAIDISPDGKIKIMMGKAVARVASYKRKVGYLLAKSKKAQILNRLQAEKAGGKTSTTNTVVKSTATVEPTKTNTSVINVKSSENAVGATENPELNITPLIPVNRMEYRIKAADAVDFTFHGQDEDFEFEYLATICKVYMSLAEELLTASLGVQSIKNSWNNKAVRRAMVAERRQQFMTKVTKDYLQEQNEDHVRAVWMKLRVLETRKQRLLSIMNAVQKRKADIEYSLSFVPRYHVYTQYDDNGYVYYVDEYGSASYEMPTYTFKQYLACQKIQTKAHVYIEGARQRRLHKEMLERIAIEDAERKLEEERKKALKAVDLSISYTVERFKLKSNKPVFPIVSQVISKHYNKSKKNYNMYRFVQSEEDLEKELSWKYQFNHSVVLKKGLWALLYTAGNSVTHNNFNSQNQYVPSVQIITCSGVVDGYEIVMIVKVDMTTNISCDARTVKGQILRGVPVKRIYHMNYDIHTQVESRYRYRKLFYRGEVTCMSTDSLSLVDVYKITYEDGEVEDKMGRDAIRPTRPALEAFLSSRQGQLQELRVYLRRLAFYHNQMLDRQSAAIAGEVERLQNAKPSLGDSRVENVSSAPEDQLSYFGEGDATVVDDSTYNDQLVDDNELNEEKNMDTAKENSAEGGQKEREGQLVPYEEQVEVQAVEDEVPIAEVTAKVTAESDVKSGKKGSASLPSKDKDSKASERKSTKASLPTALKPAKKKLIPRVTIAFPKIRINISKAVLQYNWSIVPTATRPTTSLVDSTTNALVLYDNNPKTIRFLHAASGEELEGADEAPYYSAREIHLIRKIQLRWKLFKSLCLYTYRALNVSLEALVKEVVGKGSKIAFVGYKMEGVTVLETLVRAGVADVAQAIQDHYHQARKPLSSLTIDELVSVSKDDYEKYGIIQAHHVREMKDFQVLYKKLSPADREKKLALFNYYSDPYDTRSIQECIKASIDTLMRKFTKAVKTGQSRTKQSLQNLIDMSHYPHSHQQVESYLKKYNDKPELIRVCSVCINKYIILIE